MYGFAENRVADVESCGNASVVTELLAGQAPLFHANAYVGAQQEGLRKVALRDEHGQRIASVPVSATVLLGRFVHLKIDEEGSVDSEHRMKRAAQLPPPTTLADVAAVLGDTVDPLRPPYCPIYKVR